MQKSKKLPELQDFYFIRIKPMWGYAKQAHFSFWMISFYLFFEYSRPQAIFPAIDFLPWAQLFLMGALAGAFFDKTVKWVSHPVNFLMIALGILIFIASHTAYFPKFSQRFYIDFYSWFVIYFLIINIVNTRERFYIFFLVFLFSAAKISVGTSINWALRGFAFTSWGLTGPRGYFQNSGELSILMLTLFPVAFKLFIYLKDRVTKFEKFLLLSFWITPVLTILGASSRGSQLALAVQLAFLFRKNIFRIKPLVMTAALFALLYHLLPDEQMERFRNMGEDQTSEQRLLYWKNGIEMINDHPFTGVGYFNFIPYYERHFPQDMLYDDAELPHNIIIQIGTDAGYPAIIVYLLLLISPLVIARAAIKENKDPLLNVLLVGISYGLLGFTVAGQFVSVVYYPFLWLGLAFLVAGRNVSININHKSKKKLSI